MTSRQSMRWYARSASATFRILRTGQFAHAAGIMVLTPQGKVARYLFGVDYAPRDLRLALVEASAGKIGSPVDQMLLFCFHYDPTFGKYTMAS